MKSNFLLESSSCRWLHLVLLSRSPSDPKYPFRIVQHDSKATMFLPLLALTLGVMLADAGKPFYEVQQQQQMPSEEGVMAEAVDDVPEAADNLAANIAFASVDMSAAPSPFGRVWCDSRYFCQTGQTCCRRSGNKWGCCPFTGGTCCYLGLVCCPPGKRCSGSRCF